MASADVTRGPAICAGHCTLDPCHVTVLSSGVFWNHLALFSVLCSFLKAYIDVGVTGEEFACDRFLKFEIRAENVESKSSLSDRHLEMT